MNIQHFAIVVVVSISGALVWELFFFIYPAWRNMKKEQAMLLLAKGIRVLNGDMLLNAKIKQGEYLHDVLYKFLMGVLCEKSLLKFCMLSEIKYDADDEKKMQMFRAEINNLNEEARQIVDNAIFASSKVIALQSPFLFFLITLRMLRVRHDFQTKRSEEFIRGRYKEFIRNSMMRSTQDYAWYMKKELSHC
jgi:hypothetical protein